MSTRRARLVPWLGVAPFLAYLAVFLVVPTITVVVGAFAEDGRPSLVNVQGLFDHSQLTQLTRSVVLSAVSAVVGAGFGGFLAYLVVTRPATSAFRRTVTAISGVLAQF